MIEDSTTWYLGTVGYGTSYKLAKYTDADMSVYATSTEAKVGLLRFGELMAGQFDMSIGLNNTDYWTLTPTLTPDSTSYVRVVYDNGYVNYDNPTFASGVRPSMNLKSNVVITGGEGTKEQPFELSVQ